MQETPELSSTFSLHLEISYPFVLCFGGTFLSSFIAYKDLHLYVLARGLHHALGDPLFTTRSSHPDLFFPVFLVFSYCLLHALLTYLVLWYNSMSQRAVYQLIITVIHSLPGMILPGILPT